MSLTNGQVHDLSSAIIEAVKAVLETGSTRFVPAFGECCGEEVDLATLSAGALVSANGSEYFCMTKQWVRYDGMCFPSEQVSERLRNSGAGRIVHFG